MSDIAYAGRADDQCALDLGPKVSLFNQFTYRNLVRTYVR